VPHSPTSFSASEGPNPWISVRSTPSTVTTVGRSDTAIGAFYRRLSSRAGKSKAVTATARKIAVLFYNTLRHGMSYRDPGADHYEQQYRNRVLANLQRRAKSLGFVLQAIPGDADPAVS
jgi:transposase